MSDIESEIKQLKERLSRVQSENVKLTADNIILKAELELARGALAGLATIYDDQRETVERAQEYLERN